MASKYIISNINLNGNQIENAKFEVLSSAPANPVTGRMYYDSTKNKVGYYNGSKWEYVDGDVLKQVADLDSYVGTNGEIVQYVGESNGRLTNGLFYKFTNKLTTFNNRACIDDYDTANYYLVTENVVPGMELTYFKYVGTNNEWSTAAKLTSTGYDFIVGAKIYDITNNRTYVITSVTSNVINYNEDPPNPYTDYSPFQKSAFKLVNDVDTWVSESNGNIYTINSNFNHDVLFQNIDGCNRVYGYVDSSEHLVSLTPGDTPMNLNLNRLELIQIDTTDISNKQNTITGAASTVTTSNLTASKILGSNSSGKIEATSISTTDASDAVSKKHTQNTDTKIVSGNNKVEVSSSGTTVTGNGSVTGNLSVSGNLNVTGTETVTEIVHVESENDTITLRKGAQTAIGSGDLSGTFVKNYDGLNSDLLFGTDSSGIFRIGDSGGTLEPICTRAESSNLAAGDALIWDATNQRAVGTKTLTGVTAAKAIDGNFGRLGGANQAVSRTVEELMTEVTTSGGICGGSINIATASKGVGTGWYNFIYIPHRSGVGDDNPRYGTLIMTSMLSGGYLYIITKSNNVIYDARVYRTTSSDWVNDRVLMSYGGIISSSSVTTTELSYLSGVTSNIQTQLNTKAPSVNTVNGAPLSNAASYFYGVSTSAANATQKEVNIPSITTLNAGQVIVVVPTITTNFIADATLKLNSFAAYKIKYHTSERVDGTIWYADVPTMFLFDGTNWRLVARGYDLNTLYESMSVAEGTTGTATASRTVRADYLQQIIHGQIDKFVGSRAMTEDAYWDLETAGTVQNNVIYITYEN